MWDATKDSLRFGLSNRQLWESYSAFAKSHDLPSHKALRKTTAQWIEDNVGETEARLFRCESKGDTHNRNYIRSYTPAQVLKLELAILKAGEHYGIR